jgi:hypothetical protein
MRVIGRLRHENSATLPMRLDDMERAGTIQFELVRGLREDLE